MIPIHQRTDREILQAALMVIGRTRPADAQLMWIRNTLDVRLACSEAYCRRLASGRIYRCWMSRAPCR